MVVFIFHRLCHLFYSAVYYGGKLCSTCLLSSVSECYIVIITLLYLFYVLTYYVSECYALKISLLYLFCVLYIRVLCIKNNLTLPILCAVLYIRVLCIKNNLTLPILCTLYQVVMLLWPCPRQRRP